MRRVLVVLTGLVGALLVGGPASASNPTLVVASATLATSGCTPVDYTFNADPPPGYVADVDIYVTSPGGGYVTDVFPAGSAGSGSFQVCSHVAGTYRAAMDDFACTSDYSSCQDIPGPSVTFQVIDPNAPPPPAPPPPPAATTTKVTLSAHVSGDYVDFRVRRLVNNRSPGVYDFIYLQLYDHGGWHKVGHSREITNKQGKVTETYNRPTSRLKVRAATEADDGSGLVYSKPVTIA